MAYTTFNTGTGGQIVHRFDDIQSDFPSSGLGVSDSSVAYVENTTGQDIVLEITFDNQDRIRFDDEPDPRWSTYNNISSGTNEMFVFNPGPTGVRLTANASGGFAWIRS